MFLDSHYKRLIEVGGVGTHLHQWVSNLSVQRKLLQLVKAHSTGSCPRVSDSVALVRSRIYICNQFPGDGRNKCFQPFASPLSAREEPVKYTKEEKHLEIHLSSANHHSPNIC
jgi:hypothetical protein